MHFSVPKLRDIQKATAKQAVTEDTMPIEDIKRIAAFGMAFFEDQIICSTAVFSYPELKILEKRTLVKKAPMNYIPTFLCFREGPLILESYYNLETEPDLLLIHGHGIAHPYRAGLATYVGTELEKPTIGVASKLIEGVEEKDGKLYLEGEEVGRAIKPTQYANKIYINPGNRISIETAEKIVSKMIMPPHKMPEPLHMALKFANKAKKELIKKPKEIINEITE